MKIGKPRIIRQNDESVYVTDVSSANDEKTLWYSVQDEHREFMTESCDAPLVALLIPAMAQGEDLFIDGIISEKLYYNLSRSYQKLLRQLIPWLKQINIYPSGLETTDRQALGVATGFTGGIDSFSVLADHYYGVVPESFKITLLLFHNTGSHGTGGQHLFAKRYARLQPLADRLGLKFLKINSNLDAFYDKRLYHQQTHTARSMSAVLLLQNGIGRYMYASTYSYADTFVGQSHDIAYLDPIALPLLSTESLEVFSVGGEYTRVEKTLVVASIEDSYDALDVCVNAEYSGSFTNCSTCKKCLRTILTLDIVGVDELYSDSFDLDLYRQHRARYLASVLSSRNPLEIEIAQFASARGYPIPYQTYLYLPAYYAVNQIRRMKKS